MLNVRSIPQSGIPPFQQSSNPAFRISSLFLHPDSSVAPLPQNDTCRHIQYGLNSSTAYQLPSSMFDRDDGQGYGAKAPLLPREVAGIA